MKRKVKRYNEGELVDSFSEYQGFGQMGPRTIQEDINAAAEEEKKRPKIKESISVSEFAEPGGAGFSRTSVTKAPAKAPIVTKEQMQKAGFDNLRDYMNAQKGLTRRGAPAKPAAQAASPKPAKSSEVPTVAEVERQRETTGTGTDLATKTKEGLSDTAQKILGAAGLGGGAYGAYKLAQRLKTPAQKVAGLLGRSEKAGETLSKDMGPVQYAGKRSMLQNQRGEGVITPAAKPFAQRDRRRLLGQDTRGESVIEMGMKKGGKVGSASRRADGIAMRGKTRGKYI